MKHVIYPGGLMRCCLKSLEDFDDSQSEVNQLVPCKWCDSYMILTKRGWEWSTARQSQGDLV